MFSLFTIIIFCVHAGRYDFTLYSLLFTRDHIDEAIFAHDRSLKVQSNRTTKGTNPSYKYIQEPADQAATSNKDKDTCIKTREAENPIYGTKREPGLVIDREYEEVDSIKDHLQSSSVATNRTHRHAVYVVGTHTRRKTNRQITKTPTRITKQVKNSSKKLAGASTVGLLNMIYKGNWLTGSQS